MDSASGRSIEKCGDNFKKNPKKKRMPKTKRCRGNLHERKKDKAIHALIMPY